ncbi:MAG: beta-propeller fold lactonase family protein [Pseudomonadota bacterium]
MTSLIGTSVISDAIFDFTTSPELSGAWEVQTTEVNGKIYVYVSADSDDGIQVLTIDGDGQLSPVDATPDTAPLGLNGAQGLRIVEVGAKKFVVVIGRNDSAIGTYEIDTTPGPNEGTLIPAQTLFNTTIGGFSFPSYLESATVGGNTFLIGGAPVSDSLSVFQIDGDGNLTLTDQVFDADNPDFELDDVQEIEVATIGGATYVYATSFTDNGVSVFSLSSGGVLTSVQNVPTNGGGGQSIVVGEVDGQTMLFVANTDANAIDAYTVANDGTLTFAAQTTGLADVFGLELVEIDGVTFLAGAEFFNDRVNLYSIAADGSVEVVETINDTASVDVRLNGAFHIEPLEIDGRQFLLVTGNADAGLTVIELGSLDDAILGTADDDGLIGLAGDDDLIGLDGDDFVSGGDGDDVISGRRGDDNLDGGADDDVIVGGVGNDTIRGGEGADVLVAGLGRDAISYTDSNLGVAVNLGAGTADNGHATGDVFLGFEDIIGSGRRDTLTGDDENNEIDGANGADIINGGGGRDIIAGGNGPDTIDGGGGDDIINGNGGSDDIFGGAGADNLNGAGGRDELVGGIGDDTLSGGGGRDTIDGGAGDDMVDAGAGFDLFIFADGFGNDTVSGFDTAEDTIDFSELAAISSFAEFQAAAFTFSGNTVVSIDGNTSILIENVEEADFSASNFLFV